MERLIYGLKDPRDLVIKYIGRSSSGLRRPSTHQAPSVLRRDQTPKGEWLKELKAQGLRAEIVVLQEVATEKELVKAEKHWIKSLRNHLKNVDWGGYPGPQSELHKRHISEAHKRAGHKPNEFVLKRSAEVRRTSFDWKEKRLKTMGCRDFEDQFGNVYHTIQGAAQKLGLQKGNVHRVLNPGRYHYKSTGGYIFKYID